MKYPIGIQSFEEIRKNGCVYIDKTALIHQLIDNGKYYFLSRPRRFGKSLLISTLEAYFLGKKELFKGLAMEQLETEWITYPVLRFDFKPLDYTREGILLSELDRMFSKWEKLYHCKRQDTPSLRLGEIIETAHKQTGKQVVILVDDYDRPLLQSLNDTERLTRNWDMLKAMYCNLKSKDAHIHFAILTGKIQYPYLSIFGDFNNLYNISTHWRYHDLCGFTNEEVRSNFLLAIQALADSHGLSIEACIEKMRDFCAGYHFNERSSGLYNPSSVLDVLSLQTFHTFRLNEEDITFIKAANDECTKYNNDIENVEVMEETIESIVNHRKSAISTLYRLGYLTIKDYDEEFGMFTLGFPNQQMKETYKRLLGVE